MRFYFSYSIRIELKHSILMKKIIQLTLSTIFTVGILLGSGFIYNPFIVSDVEIWVVILSIIVMLTTQPPMRKTDLLNPTDRYSMLGIFLMAIVVHNLAVLEWAMKTTHQFSISFQKTISFVMIWGGIIFRIYAIKTLSIYFSNAAEIQDTHVLYDEGIYAKVRHPSYTGAICTIIGTLIWLEAWNVFIICLLVIILAYWHRIKQEEKILTNHFKEKYIQYRQKTGCLFSKIKLGLKPKRKVLKIICKKK
jgi:protein-S-isoprenylcysteine O-methyltransferase Ste14